MHYHFPSIEKFSTVVKQVERYPHIAGGPVQYRAKVKLHGTNAGIQISKRGAIPQGRNVVLTADIDASGFAAWVAANHDYLASRYQGEDFCIFGEWCGPGIMKKTAIQRIPKKIFVVFCLQYGLTPMSHAEPDARVVTDPDEIRRTVGLFHPDIFILPWYREPIMVDFFDRDSMEALAAYANEMVSEVETRDPFVYENFGIEGLGEGVVFYPTTVTSRFRFGDLVFKGKGIKHKVIRTREAVQVDPEVVASINEFVRLVVTEARLEQGLAEACDGRFDKRQVGPFLAWFGRDVKKETTEELRASNLAWHEVEKPVTRAARDWYLARCP